MHGATLVAPLFTLEKKSLFTTQPCCIFMYYKKKKEIRFGKFNVFLSKLQYFPLSKQFQTHAKWSIGGNTFESCILIFTVNFSRKFAFYFQFKIFFNCLFMNDLSLTYDTYLCD